MERHEQTCRMNPERRTCRTCALRMWSEGDPDAGITAGWYCWDGHYNPRHSVEHCHWWERREP